MASPFPGMDPYLEDPAIWPKFQHAFVMSLYQILLPGLGDRYKARLGYRIYSGSRREEYLEIRSAGDADSAQLVTLMDVVSARNKATTEGREAYYQTRRAAKQAGASLVEIDLLREGEPMLDYSRENMPEWDYATTVVRGYQPEKYEVYPSVIKKRLPRFRMPLAQDDRDTVIDLQVAFSRSYDQGGFSQKLDYSSDPRAPLKEKHRVWLDELLQHHKLRPPHEEVARLAYSFWENEGRPHGRDREHWERAVEQLRSNISPLAGW